MNKAVTSGAVAFLLLTLSGCATTSRRLQADAERCEQALEAGRLAAAEVLCQRALGDEGNALRDPALRSQRQFRLAGIKRQLGKYAEAQVLLEASLAIEESLAGPRSRAVAERLLEKTFVLAGQGQWQAGGALLERVLPLGAQLGEDERRQLLNSARTYAARLDAQGRGALAARLRAAAGRLSQAHPD